MTEEHIQPDEGLQPAENAGSPLSEGEAEAAKGRCGPNNPNHCKDCGGCDCPPLTNPNPQCCLSKIPAKECSSCGCTPSLDLGAGETAVDVRLGVSFPSALAMPEDNSKLYHRSMAPGNRRVLATEQYLQEDGGTGNVTVYGRGGGKYTYTYAAGSYASENGTLTKLTGQVGGPWAEAYPDGSQQVYEKLSDGYGHISRRADRHGNAVYYGYNGSAQQVAVHNGLGLCTYLEYDGSGNPVKVVDFKGRTTYLEYNGAGDLTKIKRPGGCQTQFLYDANKKILAEEDADGFVTYFDYGGDAYLDKISREDGASGQARVTYYSYPSVGANAKAIDALGRVTYYALDGAYNIKSEKNPAAEETQKGWTGNFQLSREQDALGNTTYMEYDAYGNVSNRKDPLGHVSQFQYQANQELLKSTDPLGGVRQSAYDSVGNRVAEVDALGHVTYFQFSAGGLLIKRVNALGQAGYWEYDSYGERTSAKDGRGNQTRFGYEWNWDGQGGRKDRTQDANNNTAYLVFDACDRVVKSIDELGNYEESGYDGRGNQTVGRDKLGNYSYFEYNAFGEMVRRRQLVSGQWEESTTYFDAGGQVERTFDAEGQASYFSYDPAGRPTVVSDALGRETQTVYDQAGRQVARVDAAGAATYFIFDAAGRQVGTAGPAAASEVESVALQDGLNGYAGTRDNYMYYYYLDTNYGTATDLVVFGDGYRSLLKFAVFESEGGPVPDGSVIISAALKLYKYGSYPSELSAFEVLKAWEELESTPRRASNLEEWAVTSCRGPGEDHAVERVGWGQLSYTAGQWLTLDVTRSLSRWGSGLLPNNGWVLHDWYPYDTQNPRHYYSRHYTGDTTLRPKLEIIYAPRGSYTELDANGRAVASWSSGGGVAEAEYDLAGNVLVSRDALGHETLFAYDVLNRQNKIFAADGGVVESEYDAAGNRISLKDALGNITQSSFDKLNRLAWQRDAAGYFTYYEYTARSEQSQVKNPRGAMVKSYFDAAGRPVKQTDPLNVTTYLTFDEAGRTTKTHLPALNQATYLEYDKAGRNTHIKTTPDGSTIYDTETVYDAAGQTVRAVNPRGYTAYFEYDAVGRMQKQKTAMLNEIYFGYDAVGNRVLSVSPKSYASYFGYDVANRLTAAKDAEDVVAYFEFDANGNRTAAIVGLGAEARRTEFGYDEMNRLSAVTAPGGGVTVFKYDLNGNRTEERNPVSAVTKYGYNERSELVRVQDALGETAYYEYNEAGSLKKSTSPAGRVGNFEHDLAERLMKAYYNDGYTAYFAHDAAGNMIAAKESAEGTVYFAHDRMNRVTSQKFAVGGEAVYVYDENSNRTKLVYPSGGTAYYTFDELDRISSVKAPSGNITSYLFDKSGNRTKSVWGNASYSYYEFDKAERIASIRHFDDAGSPLAYFDYGRDGRGNITKIARLDGITTYFGYDQANRLSSEIWKNAAGTSIYAFEWDYDVAGNRVSSVEQGENIAWAYNAAGAITRRTDASGTTYYHHDLDGNLEIIEATGGVVTYFEHGGHGLVTKIKPLGGTEIVFGYDALLRRVRMTEGALTTYFRHDGIDLLEISTSAGSVTKLTHGYKVINGIGSVVEVDVDGTRYYLHIDHRGTCYKITDADGNVVWTGLCDAWGKALSEVGFNPTVFWYQGQAWWKLTVNGRFYYVSPTRIFDPQDARFIERDWLDSLSGEYGYLATRPVNMVDASGSEGTAADAIVDALLEEVSSKPPKIAPRPPQLPPALQQVESIHIEGTFKKENDALTIGAKVTVPKGPISVQATVGVQWARRDAKWSFSGAELDIALAFTKADFGPFVLDGKLTTKSSLKEDLTGNLTGDADLMIEVKRWWVPRGTLKYYSGRLEATLGDKPCCRATVTIGGHPTSRFLRFFVSSIQGQGEARADAGQTCKQLGPGGVLKLVLKALQGIHVRVRLLGLLPIRVR